METVNIKTSLEIHLLKIHTLAKQLFAMIIKRLYLSQFLLFQLLHAEEKL